MQQIREDPEDLWAPSWPMEVNICQNWLVSHWLTVDNCRFGSCYGSDQPCFHNLPLPPLLLLVFYLADSDTCRYMQIHTTC